MKEIISKIFNSKFARNVTILISGTAAAQAITMLASPIITRLYGPEAFGVMGTFNAIIGIIGPIAALSYPIAIVLPKSNRNAKGLIKLSLIITIIISILSILIVSIFHESIVELFNLTEVSTYLYLIPLIIIFSGLMQIAEQWLIRTNQFSISARVTLLQSIIINGGKVGIGFFYPVAAVLVALTTVRDGFKAFMMIFFAKKSNVRIKLEHQNERKSLRTLAKEYYDFPLYRAPQSLLFGISSSLPVLMLASLFGPVSAGYYSLGNSVMSLPTNLIGKSFGDVFYAKLSDTQKIGNQITHMIIKATFGLFLVGLIPFGIVIVYGPTLFSFVFGNEWFAAGEYARWIALFVFLRLLHQPSVKALPVLSAQGFLLLFTILTLLINIISLIIGSHIFSNDLIAIVLFSISNSLLSVLLILITLKISRKYDKKIKLTTKV